MNDSPTTARAPEPGASPLQHSARSPRLLLVACNLSLLAGFGVFYYLNWLMWPLVLENLDGRVLGFATQVLVNVRGFLLVPLAVQGILTVASALGWPKDLRVWAAIESLTAAAFAVAATLVSVGGYASFLTKGAHL